VVLISAIKKVIDMKGFRKGAKSDKAVLDLATGELQSEELAAPYVRPPWYRARLKVLSEGETMTQQSHRDQTDINNIVNRYARTGQLPPATRQAQYADVTGLQGDLTELVARSNEHISTADADLTKHKADKVAAEKAAKVAAEKAAKEAKNEPPTEDKKE